MCLMHAHLNPTLLGQLLKLLIPNSSGPLMPLTPLLRSVSCVQLGKFVLRRHLGVGGDLGVECPGCTELL